MTTVTYVAVKGVRKSARRVSAQEVKRHHRIHPLGYAAHMKQRHPFPRRGNCAFQVLLGLAVLALLVAIYGAVSALTSGVGDAFKSIQTIISTSNAMEAPGTAKVTMPQGGGLLAFHPDGKVGDKIIGRPPANVTYTVSITGPDGTTVPFQKNTAPRDPNSPFEMLGFFETETDGEYSFDVQASDGSTPAAIMIASADSTTAKALGSSFASAFGGSCLTICGCTAALAFGIPALIVRRKAKNAAASLPQV